MKIRPGIGPDVKAVYERISPSKLDIEDPAVMTRVKRRLEDVMYRRLKLPPDFFRGKQIIDFGCGTGELDIVFGQWGARVLGIDFNPLSIERAEEVAKRFGLDDQLRYQLGDINTWHLEKATFDVAYCDGVLPHVENPRLVLENLISGVREGGMVILGYLDILGNLQREAHGVIIRALAGDKREDIQDVCQLAQELFGEHLARSVRFGQRSVEAIVNDYIVNRHSHGIDTRDMLAFFHEQGFQLFSSYPLQVNFCQDIPADQPERSPSPISSLYLRFQQFSWMTSAGYSRWEELEKQESEKTNSALADLANGIEDPRGVTPEKYSSTVAEAKFLLRRFEQVVQGYVNDLCEALGEVQELHRLLVEDVPKQQWTAKKSFKYLFQGFHGFSNCYLCFQKLHR